MIRWFDKNSDEITLMTSNVHIFAPLYLCVAAHKTNVLFYTQQNNAIWVLGGSLGNGMTSLFVYKILDESRIEHFTLVLFSLMKSYGVTIQMKATEQYFTLVLFVMLYKVVLTVEYVHEILWFDHLNESHSAVLPCDTVYYVVYRAPSVTRLLH